MTRCEGESGCANAGTVSCEQAPYLSDDEKCDALLCESCADTVHRLCGSCLLLCRAEEHLYVATEWDE